MRNRQRLCGLARFAYRAWNCRVGPKERDSCPNRPQTATKFGDFPALLQCTKRSAQSTLGNPSRRPFGQIRQYDLSRCLAPKYPNSLSQNTKGCAFQFRIADQPGQNPTRVSQKSSSGLFLMTSSRTLCQ
jgi:hypothetical protein